MGIRRKSSGWASGGSPHSRERKEYRLGIRRKSSFQVEERIEAGHQEKGIMPCRRDIIGLTSIDIVLGDKRN